MIHGTVFLLLLCALQLQSSPAFTSPHHARATTRTPVATTATIFRNSQTAHIGVQRSSVAQTRLMGLFGLGVPELVIIAVAGVIVVGPTNLGRTMGNFAGSTMSDMGDLEELKKIPTEFQKGVEEGEMNVRSRKAKQMEMPPPEDDEKSGKNE